MKNEWYDPETDPIHPMTGPIVSLLAAIALAVVLIAGK